MRESLHSFRRPNIHVRTFEANILCYSLLLVCYAQMKLCHYPMGNIFGFCNITKVIKIYNGLSSNMYTICLFSRQNVHYRQITTQCPSTQPLSLYLITKIVHDQKKLKATGCDNIRFLMQLDKCQNKSFF